MFELWATLIGDIEMKTMTTRVLAHLSVLVLLLCGCVYRLRPYNSPSEEKIRVDANRPDRFAFQVDGDSAKQVSPDGEITLNIPAFERGCATYLFGAIKLKDSSADEIRSIHVKRDNITIQKLSLRDIKALPVDSYGYHIIKLE